MNDFISSFKQEEYADKLRKLKQTYIERKLFSKEIISAYKKQETIVQKLDEDIKQFTEDLTLQEMQLSKQKKAQAVSQKNVKGQEEELRAVKDKLENETALFK